jgi:uridine kinase
MKHISSNQMLGYFVENDVVMFFFIKENWQSFIIHQNGYNEIQKIKSKPPTYKLKEMTFEWSSEDKSWKTEKSIMTKLKKKIEDFEGLFFQKKEFFILHNKEMKWKPYIIDSKGIETFEVLEEDLETESENDDLKLKWMGNCWKQTQKDVVKFYVKNKNVSREGYFTNFKTNELYFIHLGNNNWNSYIFNNGDVHKLKKINSTTFEINLDSKIEWCGDCWKFFKKEENFILLPVIINHVNENYFSNEFSTIFVLIGDSWNVSYIIDSNGVQKMTQIKDSTNKYIIKENETMEWKDSTWIFTNKNEVKVYENEMIKMKDSEIQKIPKVCIIGIGGCSASGKSTISKKLANQMNSPFKPICGDFYFDNVPLHEKWGRNYEVPEAMNFIAIKKGLRMLKTHFSIFPFKPFEQNIALERKSHYVHLPVHSKDYKIDKNDDFIFIVVESFLLFIDKELCEMIDIPIFIDCPQDVVRARRVERDKCSVEWFDEMVWNHFEKFKELQIQNSSPLIVDGTKPIEESLEIIENFIKNEILK